MYCQNLSKGEMHAWLAIDMSLFTFGARMIFVRYRSADVAQLAMKMFPFLNLKVATVNDGTKKQGIRKKGENAVMGESIVEKKC